MYGFHSFILHGGRPPREGVASLWYTCHGQQLCVAYKLQYSVKRGPKIEAGGLEPLAMWSRQEQGVVRR